ncbi:hypothetical protein CSUI_008068 [Cystoisospora suis]|uniref:Uncharacterized protein n=1 Tax=Cystoisospora suis TaxID=483139 RepID=A0A2C6KNZ9_9APIC|nr:hypothetical protein CSUI_008068 [Cystoisospora suis]
MSISVHMSRTSIGQARGHNASQGRAGHSSKDSLSRPFVNSKKSFEFLL